MFSSVAIPIVSIIKIILLIINNNIVTFKHSTDVGNFTNKNRTDVRLLWVGGAFRQVHIRHEMFQIRFNNEHGNDILRRTISLNRIIRHNSLSNTKFRYVLRSTKQTCKHK